MTFGDRLVRKLLKQSWGKSVVYPFFSHRKDPVLIFGNQKSGTTAITALLGKLTGLTYADYLPGFTQPVLHDIQNGNLSLDKAIRRQAKVEFSKAIIKECSLTLFYEQLAPLYPASPKIFIVRDPRDNLRSLLNYFSLPADTKEYKLSGLHMQTEWEHVLNNDWLGLPSPSPIHSLANRWRYLADIYQKFERDFILVRYEDFMQDKAARIKALAGELGLEAKYSIDHLVDHPFQPPGDRHISWIDFFGTEKLAIINDICGDYLAFFGYPDDWGQ